MDFHLWTPLISAVLALAIAVKVVLRSRKRHAHWRFVMFASNVAVWYLATFLEYRGVRASLVMGRITALVAIALPQTGVRFLRAFRDEGSDGPGAVDPWLTRLSIPLLVLVFSPWFDDKIPGAIIRAAISAYVVGLLIAAVSGLYTRGRAIQSRLERRRVLYLAGVGVLATLVTTADLIPFTINKFSPNFPPVGSVLVLAVLYLFSEVIERQRLVDLYELAGRFLVLTALALVLAGIYYRLVDWQVLGGAPPRQGPYFLNAIVASLVILIVFDPVRAKVEAQIGRFFFNEQVDLERTVTDLRRRLAHVLELDVLGRMLIQGIEESHRVTSAALYLLDADRREFNRVAVLSDTSPARVDLASLRPIIEQLRANGAVVREQVERDQLERAEIGENTDAFIAVTQALDTLAASVVLPLESDDGDIVGLITLHDDRVRDAFSPEEVQILQGLAVQVGIAVENSRIHARIKERDRLAALGEMAAGLAHEIRNPLGSIKAAAQVMESSAPVDSQEREFLGIIIEEVGRLNRVVSSFLDYSRPYTGAAVVLDVAHIIDRSAELLRGDLPAGISLVVEDPGELPPVRIDPEHLRQVLLNLVRNATEAMKGRGTVTVATHARKDSRGDRVELSVRDTGPGIDATVLRNLFVPFVTTKASGTGLGLAISQRIIESAGGRIEVRASGATGSTFVVVLPVSAPG